MNFSIASSKGIKPAPPGAATPSVSSLRERLLRATLGRLGRAAPGLAAAGMLALLSRPRARRYGPGWPKDLGVIACRKRLPCGGRTLTLHEWGEGPLALLVHDWGGDAPQWGPLVRPLLKAGLRVVAFDAPAHGASSGGSTDFVAFAAAIAAVARHSGPVRCMLGHGFGAAMSLYALRDWGFQVDRFVLLGACDHAGWPLAALARRAGIGAEVCARVRHSLSRRYSYRLDWSRLDVSDMLRQLEQPILLVHDEGDEEVPFAQGMALACSLPVAQVCVTRGLGHRGLLSSAAVVDRIVSFAAS